MHPRPSFLAAGILLFTVPASPALTMGALHAQAAQFGVRRAPPAAPVLAGPQLRLVTMPDSARRYPPTHWKTGLLIGGILGGAFGAALGSAFCGLSESTRDCTGAALGGALMIGTSAGAIGALVGGLFPARPRSRSRNSPSSHCRAFGHEHEAW
jgi:hypothetical protein